MSTRDPETAGGFGDQREVAAGHRRQLDTVHARPEEPDLAQRGRVKGAGLHPGDAQLRQPVPQFTGGLGGEGDRQGMAGIEPAGQRAVRDAVGDRPGLAGSGTGEHCHRRAEAGGHGLLLRVEPLQHLGCPRWINFHDAQP